MDSSERNSLLQRLDESRDALLAIVAGVTEQQSRYKTSPERWSIAECMEHVVLAERNMYLMLAYAHTQPELSGSLEREQAILGSQGGDRNRKISAPEQSKPTGLFSSFGEATAEFVSARKQTSDYLAACEDDLRLRSAIHPIMGPINGQECLAIIIVHPLRHVEQIREIKSSAHYPQP